jgi:hypothetical protein
VKGYCFWALFRMANQEGKSHPKIRLFRDKPLTFASIKHEFFRILLGKGRQSLFSVPCGSFMNALRVLLIY